MNALATPSPSAPLHPFYPVAALIPTYKPNTLHPIALLLLFFIPLAGLMALCHRNANRFKLSGADRLWVLWFGASGCIHVFFEGYFAFNHSSMAGSNYVEAQMWKMYGLSDSRYITNDVFTYVMEGCTALFWGPCCLALSLYLIPKKNSFRHPIQIIVSVGQVYGLVLYYAIPVIDEMVGGPLKRVSRPEVIYFWGEFVGLNAPWLFIPAFAIWSSTKHITRAFKIVASLDVNSTIPRANKLAGDEDETLPFIASRAD